MIKREARAERGAEVGALRAYVGGGGVEKAVDYFALRYAFSTLIDLTPREHQKIADGKADEPKLHANSLSRFHVNIIDEALGVGNSGVVLEKANGIIRGFYGKARKKEA